jgi:hypothetical protein
MSHVHQGRRQLARVSGAIAAFAAEKSDERAIVAKIRPLEARFDRVATVDCKTRLDATFAIDCKIDGTGKSENRIRGAKDQRNDVVDGPGSRDRRKRCLQFDERARLVSCLGTFSLEFA